MRHCRSRNLKGAPCGCWPLKNEDFCLSHSDSKQAEEFKRKRDEIRRRNRRLMYDENGHMTQYYFFRSLLNTKKKLIKCKKTSVNIKAKTIMMLDKGLLKIQKRILEEEMEKKRREKAERNSFEARLEQAQREKLESTKIS